MTDRVRLGIDVLRANGFAPLKGQRVGLFTNLSATDSRLVPTYRIFTEESELDVRALFAPEHGFAGMLPDGAQVASGIDARSGLPVHSLYGDSYRPARAMLADLDVLVCDIQDIGVRYYTFTWTLSYILEAAGEAGVSVMLLDRPNPLGGAVSGAPLDPAYSSLVGRFPVPTCPGLTIGEMGRLINARHNPTPARLHVIPCEGWRRAMRWDAVGLPWIAPSPNMPQFSTALQYPGSCLIEGTILSEGRGTAHPFEIVGAPFVDGFALADTLNGQAIPGVRFRPVSFQPAASKWAGQACNGVQAHIVAAETFKPLETWLGVLMAIRARYPEAFAWLPPAGGLYHFDRLAGSGTVRAQIDAGASLEAITAGWSDACTGFDAIRQHTGLLYE